MNILKFTKQKNGNYQLLFDNDDKLLIHEDLILKYDLLLKREVAEETLKTIIEENKNYEAYNLALKFLGIKMRSCVEVEKYLIKKEFSDLIIVEVIAKLINQGYLNDERYAVAYINDRINLSNDGPHKIKEYLVANNVCTDKLDDLLQIFTIDMQHQKVKRLLDKYIKSNKKGLNLFKQKMFYNLLQLGYDKSVIEDELKNITLDESGIYQKEYDKLYQKLSKKYTGKELEYKIKQGLYRKGFSS